MAAYAPELKNGAAETYTYSFNAISLDYVKVGLKNSNGTFDEIPQTGKKTGWETGDPIYAWTIDSSTNTISMTDTQFPAGTGNVRVYRDTDLDDIPITFTAGSALSAAQLNENFSLIFDATQEIESNYVQEDGASFSQVLDANSNKVINVADGTNDNDAVNKGQLDALETDIDAKVTEAETAATTAQNWATSLDVVANSLRGARFYAQEAQEQRDWIEDNDSGVLRDTVFMGFRRENNGDLIIDYTPATTASDIDKETGDDGSTEYNIEDYLFDGDYHWGFFPAGAIDQGTNLPRFSFNNGNLIYDI